MFRKCAEIRKNVQKCAETFGKVQKCASRSLFNLLNSYPAFKNADQLFLVIDTAKIARELSQVLKKGMEHLLPFLKDQSSQISSKLFITKSLMLSLLFRI